MANKYFYGTCLSLQRYFCVTSYLFHDSTIINLNKFYLIMNFEESWERNGRLHERCPPRETEMLE